MTATARAGPAVIPRQDRLLRALRHEPTDVTPVWFMRQAGRSLPEYRDLKGTRSLLEICRDPELCARVTLQPVKRYEVDAAILYADIMHPLAGIGVDLEIVENVGPVIARPVRDERGLDALRDLEPEEDLPFVTADIHAVLDELHGSLPLIGFCGAPFTLASYLVEGRPSRDFLQTKRLMYGEPAIWRRLMDRLARIVVQYGAMQARAGVHALQLFDSWAGSLSVDDYERYVLPHTRAALNGLAETGLPLIHFGTDTGSLLESMCRAGNAALGVDWREPLDRAWRRIGFERSIQGNLDPMVLLAPWQVVKREAAAILDRAGGRSGHIFNTGHGLHPQTPPETVARLVEFVHEHRPGE